MLIAHLFALLDVVDTLAEVAVAHVLLEQLLLEWECVAATQPCATCYQQYRPWPFQQAQAFLVWRSPCTTLPCRDLALGLWGQSPRVAPVKSLGPRTTLYLWCRPKVGEGCGRCGMHTRSGTTRVWHVRIYHTQPLVSILGIVVVSIHISELQLGVGERVSQWTGVDRFVLANMSTGLVFLVALLLLRIHQHTHRPCTTPWLLPRFTRSGHRHALPLAVPLAVGQTHRPGPRWSLARSRRPSQRHP